MALMGQPQKIDPTLMALMVQASLRIAQTSSDVGAIPCGCP